MKQRFFMIICACMLTCISSTILARPAWLSGKKWPPGCDTRDPQCECQVKIDVPDIAPPPTDVGFVSIDYSTEIALGAHAFMALPTNATLGGGITVLKIFYTDDNSCAPKE